ncbi:MULTISPECIES: [protein-PII] uridylyltransferase [Moraxella]|uniref:Bifunctional uridylyltransferase/uridylyl-removing enzyme n=1 Tax=Moraxella lacunata TaxID=477 RepID=A0A1B8PV40_MORLA|nr:MULTISPECIES: [protein-PII] uridylyltransferase [Moraxella]MBE9579148.1 [protein-PII] uridylyltransferase [Moraxella sp. K1664]MBE9588438.1 [protein-PII] uridylyltransferase [Moraxella sp. K1630]MBE9596598.1 [protein-PII] uridylyltransferase [Moraxella sp. K2450]MDH9219150.1 [protein-PII] uridylyltransferase [Moraxella lacunata]MDI4483147.1 [protein-PII] uridylyltransferase [Moraxella lacunata]
MTQASLPLLPPLPPYTPTAYKAYLNELNADIDKQICEQGIHATETIDSHIARRTQAVDNMLVSMFEALFGTDSELGLFAIGGYGRGELFPASDVDILILGDDTDSHQAQIEAFVASLWDIGIEPAISVRTVSDTMTAVTEHTVATALLEARFLAGNDTLTDVPTLAVKGAWTAKAFFGAKMSESKARYLAHNATEYNLEPNIKTAPGTLRDLHIILWLGKFYFDGVREFHDLVEVGFLSPDKYATLESAKRFLWCLRHHLHTHVARHDDRLLFDRQRAVAVSMGLAHTDDDNRQITHALEQLMRTYYRHAMTTASLSELLCAYFNENYLNPEFVTTPIDEHFYAITEQASPIDSSLHQDGLAKDVLVKQGKLPSHDPKIAVHGPHAFDKNPALLLRIFLVMGQQGIKKISANTLRAIYLATPRIDDDYRQHPTHQALFLANLQEPNYLFHRLRLMKRFGVLGSYLPAFGQIMGLMQYDLFHRYTVDAHTLLLIRILHRLTDVDNEIYQQKFDLVSQIYKQIHRKDILVIVALFHDIAKGRGGDHSELGAVDVYEFCTSHGMTESDSQFASWLVREHLTMSLTAQKQDISDPDVIARFAHFVGSVSRLNHLYVLTVADMNATNSELWNSWRASLLKQLYISTRQVLNLGMGVVDKDVYITGRKSKAQALLTDINPTTLHALWDELGDEYFLKHKKLDIAWQSRVILEQKSAIQDARPIIAIRPHTDLALDAIQLFICTPDRDDLFAISVCVLDRFGLSVLDATIVSATIDGVPSALDSYVLIDRFAKRDEHGTLMSDFLTPSDRRDELVSKLSQALTGDAPECQIVSASFGFNLTLKHFNVPTQVHIERATPLVHRGHHALSLITKDRSALLAKIGQIFSKLGVAVHGARITTLGERAEDIFYLSDKDGSLLDDDKIESLKVALIEILQ